MRKILLMSSALVLLSGVAEAACIQTPTCSSLGYTSTASCTGGTKCPFGNAWNCTVADFSDKITELETQITELKKEVTTSNCFVGDVLYSDLSCSSDVISGKTPIGVVFDRANKLAIALEETSLEWATTSFSIPGLNNITSTGMNSDWRGKSNTTLVWTYCQSNGKDCPAFEYVCNYKTEGTKAGDWYLPAMGELDAIHERKEILEITLDMVGGKKFSSRFSDYNWSSTIWSSNGAWRLCMACTNTVEGVSKSYSSYVRPVLAF